jgi:HSP20 family protein
MNDFDRLFAGITRRAQLRFEPNADMYVDEASGRIVVHVELAGADADHLSVALDSRHLVIAGQRIDRTGTSGAMFQKEIQYGAFVKQLDLPAPVVDTDATAVYRDGILTIELPLAVNHSYPAVRTEIRMVVKRTPA